MASIEETVLIDNCYEIMLKVLKSSGELAMEGFTNSNKSINSKLGSWDMVTYYDKAIENLFINEIHSRYPNHK